MGCVWSKVLLFLSFFSFFCFDKKVGYINCSKVEVDTQNDTVYYAKGFQIETHTCYTLVKIRNPLDKNILKEYILVPRSRTLNKIPSNGILIRTPLRHVVCFSYICEIFDVLGILNTLIGAMDLQYIGLPVINKNIISGLIHDVGSFNNPDMEKLMFIKPDCVFIDYLANANTTFNKLNIPIIYCLNYTETHPLGQAEWIRLIGLFFDKRKISDSLFFQTVHSYNELKKMTNNITFWPTVFTGIKCGRVWDMPGGKNCWASMLHDAGANYILKNDINTGSIPLTFEVVLNKSRKANYWLIRYYNLHNITYKRLEKECANYTLFDAYKKKNIYVCNTVKKSYYQALLLHPDWILKEMISLFHPELFHGHVLFNYYEKLQ